jgi:hypothetical protein
MTGYETFCLFQSLKLHFTQDPYDFFRYNGKSNVSIESFENRKDKWHFYKLSRRLANRDEMIGFITSNLLEKDNLWIGDLLTDESDSHFRKHQKVLQSLSYTFENDCRKVFEDLSNPNDAIKVMNGEYPLLLTKVKRNEIEIETVCLLNQILNFLPMWTNKIADTISWPLYRMKIVKYNPFLPQDTTRFKMLLKKIVDT